MDLVTEVDLLETRLNSGAADANHTLSRVRRLRGELDTAHVVGDLDGLAARLDKLAGLAEEKATAARAARDAARADAIARKTALVEEAEKIAAESTGWKSAGDRLKEILDEWKAAPRASKEAEQKLWDRFRAAQDTFFSRRSEVFSARDAELKGNLDRRHELLAVAEALDVDADPRAAQAKLREIQAQWHEVGRVPRDVSTGLDRRLRAVEDRVKQAMESAWRRTAPEASPLLAQVREQVAEAEQRLARAQAAGDPRRIREAQEALDAKRKFLSLAEHTG